MESLGKNEVLMEFFTEKNSLTSAKLRKIDVFAVNGTLLIDLYFNLWSGNKVKLRFSGIKRYLFYHSSEYGFYDVEILKFFHYSEGVYISLDPIDEDEVISDEDNDYILSETVEGFLLNN